jgi:hypothetical protein
MRYIYMYRRERERERPGTKGGEAVDGCRKRPRNSNPEF